jgi:hypothetical protein
MKNLYIDFSINDEGDMLIKLRPKEKLIAKIKKQKRDYGMFPEEHEGVDSDDYNLEDCTLSYFYPNSKPQDCFEGNESYRQETDPDDIPNKEFIYFDN